MRISSHAGILYKNRNGHTEGKSKVGRGVGGGTPRFSLLIKSFIIFFAGSTLKWRNTLGFDFTALTHLCFSVALFM